MENATTPLKRFSKEDKENAARFMRKVFEMLDTRVGDKARWYVDLSARTSPNLLLNEQYFSVTASIDLGEKWPPVFRAVMTSWAEETQDGMIADLTKYLDEKFPE